MSDNVGFESQTSTKRSTNNVVYIKNLLMTPWYPRPNDF